MKYLWAITGFIFLSIGVLGIILPGMPGTPFLLVALYCFSRSSERLHQWFLQTEIYQNHLKDFHQKRALTKKAKYWILTIATLTLAIGFYFTPSVTGKIIILTVLAVKYWFFFFWIKNSEDLN
ncbi:hypothetical protein C8D76_11722 [Pasteurella langaaensis DSM 22999]|uniref:Inner membrane protein n=1 Tax=Alitibacter langaaensis DSM 22999 TaxID=1122935 RepID=A0A2U0SKW2_9PAST|nr:YbaN family protein [Pasteurella langaaensis]PVX31973.1 hypothetical protein C8D76_11722 [Pasteurella langaaensis DSM 22999]